MPQRTIAAGGGNWNSTSTWVEGAVPTTSDFVVGNASSGQLTINVAAACQYVDFTSWTNTLTMNNTLTLSLAASTNTFGLGMSFTGTNAIIINSTSSINQLTTNRIPSVTLGNMTLTLLSDLYFTHFNFGGANSSATSTVARNFYVGGDFLGAAASFTIQANVTLTLDGTGSVNARLITANGLLVINTSGTLTFDTTNGIAFLNNARLTYLAGTLITPCLRWTAQSGGNTLTLNTSGVTFDNLIFTDLANSSTHSFVLGQNFNVGTLIMALDRGSGSETIQFTSTGALNVTDRMILQCNTSTSGGILRLNTTGGHYIDKLFSLSGSFAKYTFRSATNGVKALLRLGDKNNSPIFYVDFIDINASSGQEVRTYQGTVSNCDNVVSYSSTIFGGSGGGASAYTFIS